MVISESSGYDYRGYIIQDSTDHGLWYVIDADHKVIGSFPTSEDAEEFIDNMDKG